MSPFFTNLAAGEPFARRPAMIIFLLPLLFFLGLVWLRISNKDLYSFVVKEDGPVEYATCICYVFGSILALVVGLQFLKQSRKSLDGWLHLLLSIGMFFVAGEEVSWGQRLMGVESPEFFVEHNLQGEITLHNLVHGRYVHALYVLVGCYGCLAFWLLPNVVRRRLEMQGAFVTPAPFQLSYFLPAVIYFSVPISILEFDSGLTWHEQEPTELLLAFGLLVHLVVGRYRQFVSAEADAAARSEQSGVYVSVEANARRPSSSLATRRPPYTVD